MICIVNLLTLLSVSLMEIVKKLDWQHDWEVEVDDKLARDRFFFEDLCLRGTNTLKETKEQITIFMKTQTFEHDLILLRTIEPLKFLPQTILKEIWIESILYNFELDLALALGCRYNSYRIGLTLENVIEMADECLTEELYAACKKIEGDLLFEELAQMWACEFANYFD